MDRSMELAFRKAQPQDAAQIVRFQVAMALETEDLKLDVSTCTAGVEALFQHPHHGQYYVCESAKKVVGCLLIIPEWSDWRNGTVWWIHSVYVTPQARGLGVFSRFYEYIKGIVDDTPQLRGLRLYVDKRNTHAQGIYRKLGMSNQHYELYEWLKETQT